jgi:hypothetical protein
MRKVLFISAMRLGDSLHLLPVASWLHKQGNVKLDWMYHKTNYINSLVDIGIAQPCINAMREFNYDDVSPWKGRQIVGCWRPFHLVADYADKLFNGYYDEIYCFGYSKEGYEHRKIEFFSEHFAQEHGLGVDYDFKLDYGPADPSFKDHAVKLDKMYAPLLQDMQAIELSEDTHILRNLQLCAGAKEVITTRTGSAVALSLARIPFKIKFVDGDFDWYMQLCHQITGGVQRIE